MLYLIYGDNRGAALKRYQQLVASQAAKYPEMSVFHLEAENASREQWEELVVGQSLFTKKYIVTARDFLATADNRDLVLSLLEAIATSTNLFFLLERDIEAKTLKAISKMAFKVEELTLAEQATKSVFNPFALADALGERDRERLWVALQEATFRGVEVEESFWKLVWQTKMMLLVTSQEKLITAKPFVVAKSKRYAQNFSREELVKLSSDLVKLWHDTRRGLTDLSLGLERLVFSL